MPNNDFIRLKYDTRMVAGSDEAEIMLYGEICDDWWSVVTEHRFADKSAVDFDKALKDIKGAKKVTLRINSPGGYCTEAVAMRTMLINAGFEEIIVSIEGICASAATLLACIPHAKVRMSEGSEYMIHNPAGWSYGTAEEHEKSAERLRMEEANFRGIYAKKCGKPDEDIKKWMDATTWFNAQQAKDAGFVDEIIGEEMPMVACVSPRMMTAMRALYANVPETVTEEAPQTPEEEATSTPTVSNAKPTVAAGIATEIHNEEDNPSMEISEITREQLETGNPVVYNDVMRAGAEAERARIADIDDLTPTGCEAMAAEAKRSGMSAMDYHKSIVKAQREKAAKFMDDRKAETKAAMSIPGGASEDSTGNPDEEIKKNAEEIAMYAKEARQTGDGSMY